MGMNTSTEADENALTNADLAPVPLARRTWRVGTFAALWISISACIPTYMLASSSPVVGLASRRGSAARPYTKSSASSFPA